MSTEGFIGESQPTAKNKNEVIIKPVRKDVTVVGVKHSADLSDAASTEFTTVVANTNHLLLESARPIHERKMKDIQAGKRSHNYESFAFANFRDRGKDEDGIDAIALAEKYGIPKDKFALMYHAGDILDNVKESKGDPQVLKDHLSRFAGIMRNVYPSLVEMKEGELENLLLGMSEAVTIPEVDPSKPYFRRHI